MGRPIRVEFRKARRRFDFPVAALIGVFVLLWASRSSPKTADDLATAYSALFYALPIMNTVVMPLGMAVLASRIWDVETRGRNCKLLFTLQNRTSLYAGKILLGMLENLLICAVEGGGLLLIGKMAEYTEALDWTQFLWLIVCTFAVNGMLFFSALWLSIHFSNQVPTLAVGTVGSLSGLFAAFLPEVVSLFMPWGYYIPLAAMEMRWDPATRIGWYVPREFRFWLLGITLALAAFCIWGGQRALMKKEV